MASKNKVEVKNFDTMTLDEAIEHCGRVATEMALKCNDVSCAREHVQLEHWLMELKHRRKLDEQKEPIADAEIERFLRNHRSNGEVSMMYACRIIDDLYRQKKDRTAV